MKTFILTILALGLLVAPGRLAGAEPAVAALAAPLTVSGFFGNHMVLQRGAPIRIWGTAAPGATVDVSLAEQGVSVRADAAGQWSVELKGMDASGPFELKAASGSGSRTIKDVMIGDLWVISGQSNVVLPVSAGQEWPELKTLPPFKDIRVCKLPGEYAFAPFDQFSRPITWEVLNIAKAGAYLSGVGFHFIRTIQPLAGVTVGLVQASAGGTQIEQWIPEEALKAADPENIQFEIRDKARAQLAADPAARFTGIPSGAASLYNGTIHPMRFTKWAGVVWYQGEANSRVKADYRMLLKTFVQSWRQLFGQPALPFIIVQLPNFGLPKDDGWMRLQEAQMLAARDMGLPLVVTIDQGSSTTIHPPNKAEVGRRAGLAALQHVYKKDVDGTSPLPKTVTYGSDSVVVEFDGFKGDLALKGSELKGFELAGTDHVYQAAGAAIQGRRVVVKSAAVPHPLAVRYLWVHSPEAVTLYSAAGLPAAPFRSDSTQKGDAYAGP